MNGDNNNMNFSILDVKQTKLNYEVLDPEKLQKGARILMNIRIEIGNHIEDEKLKVATVFIELYLIEQDMDDNENIPEEEYHKLNRGFYITTYRVYLQGDSFESEELEIEIIRHLEPYVKKGILDFSQEVEIPAISLPFEFWKHVQKQG